jgi:acetolactate decarboxylase
VAYPVDDDMTSPFACVIFFDADREIAVWKGMNFYCPDYFAGLNVVPYHLHFITKDRKAGGHVLEFIINYVELSVDYTSELHMILPDTEEFNSLNLIKSRTEELAKAEK